MSSSEYQTDVGILVLEPDCTVRAIAAVHASIMRADLASPVLRLDGSHVEQTDISFVQLIASTQATLAARGGILVIERASACVEAAFARSGVTLPTSKQPAESEVHEWPRS